MTVIIPPGWHHAVLSETSACPRGPCRERAPTFRFAGPFWSRLAGCPGEGKGDSQRPGCVTEGTRLAAPQLPVKFSPGPCFLLGGKEKGSCSPPKTQHPRLCVSPVRPPPPPSGMRSDHATRSVTSQRCQPAAVSGCPWGGVWRPLTNVYFNCSKKTNKPLDFISHHPATKPILQSSNIFIMTMVYSKNVFSSKNVHCKC